MIHFSQHELDAWIAEDKTLQDLTSEALGLPPVPAELAIVTRHAMTVCGVVPASRLARALGAEVTHGAHDGEQVAAGVCVLRVRGSARCLHVLWKQAMNLIEHLSGVASATANFLRAARQRNPRVQVAATRKTLPGTRRLMHYAVLCGGGIVHRSGLSETLLVFAQHRAFLQDAADWPAWTERARTAAPEKLLLVEAETCEEALLAAQLGVDGVQLDKFSPETLATLVPRLRALHPRLKVTVAGGIHVENVAAYADTGVDALVTSSLYHAKAADCQATLVPLALAEGVKT